MVFVPACRARTVGLMLVLMHTTSLEYDIITLFYHLLLMNLLCYSVVLLLISVYQLSDIPSYILYLYSRFKIFRNKFIFMVKGC
jgi:hypothetical protein